MQVILTQDIKNLGKKNDVKEVSDGYARNFLLPKKLVQIATPESIKNAEIIKKKNTEEESAKLEKSKEIAQKINNLEILISTKEKGGKLFGSISAKDIAQELKKQNFDIAEKSIKIKEAIKKIGDYKITIELANHIKTEVKVKVQGIK
jgi:large subunit ribosomal protein L9